MDDSTTVRSQAPGHLVGPGAGVGQAVLDGVEDQLLEFLDGFGEFDERWEVTLARPGQLADQQAPRGGEVGGLEDRAELLFERVGAVEHRHGCGFARCAAEDVLAERSRVRRCRSSAPSSPEPGIDLLGRVRGGGGSDLATPRSRIGAGGRTAAGV